MEDTDNWIALAEPVSNYMLHDRVLAPGATYKMLSHRPVVPDDSAQFDLDYWGICICWACTRPLKSTAWCDGQPMYDNTTHTEDWRSLSWWVGDDWATWLCRWCDIQDDPSTAMQALLVVGAMAWERMWNDGNYKTRRGNINELGALLVFVENSR